MIWIVTSPASPTRSFRSCTVELAPLARENISVFVPPARTGKVTRTVIGVETVAPPGSVTVLSVVLIELGVAVRRPIAVTSEGWIGVCMRVIAVWATSVDVGSVNVPELRTIAWPGAPEMFASGTSTESSVPLIESLAPSTTSVSLPPGYATWWSAVRVKAAGATRLTLIRAGSGRPLEA